MTQVFFYAFLSFKLYPRLIIATGFIYKFVVILEYQKEIEVLIFVILDNQCRIKDAHKIFQRKLARIATDHDFKN